MNDPTYTSYRLTKEDQNKDFFNFFDGSLTCGRCGVKLMGLRALFHNHLFDI